MRGRYAINARGRGNRGGLGAVRAPPAVVGVEAAVDVVEVEQPDAGERAGGGGDVARHPEVDDDERAAAAGIH